MEEEKMTEQEELELINKMIKDRKDGNYNQMNSAQIKETTCEEPEVMVKETTNKKEVATSEPNEFVDKLTNNEVAIKMAEEAYNNIKNQKNIAKGIKKVAIDNTKTDIESVNIKVQEKKKNNAVKRQEIRNELYKLKQEKKFLKREAEHKLAMQKFQQRKEKYGDLLLRHCRKKIKNADGKWEYQVDKEGNAIINMPNAFVLFWLIVFDSIVSFLNQTADVFSGLNKVTLKIFWIVLIIIVLFVQPVRQWLFGLIGLKLG